MEDYKQTLLILISTPLYALLIGFEMILSAIHNKHLYTVKDTFTNVYLSSLNIGLELLQVLPMDVWILSSGRSKCIQCHRQILQSMEKRNV